MLSAISASSRCTRTVTVRRARTSGRASEAAEEPATRLLGAARAARDSVGTRFPANVLEFEERAANSARAKLGDKRFAAALRHGEEMSLDDAIAYVLGDADN